MTGGFTMSMVSIQKPEKVFQYFEKICSIPHGSRNVEKISNYLVSFAKEHGLKYRQDEKYNVIIWKDGSTGYEQSEPLIIQGHMDMVAVKTADCEKNLETDGLDLEIDGDYLQAKGTSLGGDDGIAVAYALAILDDDSLAHPPIEAVFTVDEEIGMLGADYMDASDLKGRLFLNIDSEDEGVFTVSCAGGVMAVCTIPGKKEDAEGSVIRISLKDFRGGHSGVEINKGRYNANVVMGRLLMTVQKKADVRLVTINGGEKDNAIANFCEAKILVVKEQEQQVCDCLKETFAIISKECHVTDPDALMELETAETAAQVFDEESTNRVILALVHMPNGIQRMSSEIEGLVQTSLNLGVLQTVEDHVDFSWAVRSSSGDEKQYVLDKIISLAKLLGCSVTTQGAYPGWDYLEDSRLRKIMIEAYKEQYGEEPVVEGIHAGLECGLFASKLKGLDAVSIGPQMHHIHTTEERLSISSTLRTWNLIVRTLELLK